MTISEAARQAGLQASAIRYYEQIGLLPAAARVSGQRRYDTSILYRLAIIQRWALCQACCGNQKRGKNKRRFVYESHWLTLLMGESAGAGTAPFQRENSSRRRRFPQGPKA